MTYWPATLFRTFIALLATLRGWNGILLARLISGRFPEAGLRWRNRAFRTWSKTLLWAFRVHVSVEGKAPPPSSFLISNHVSYLDIMVLSSVFDAAFVAKADIKGWPMLGTIFEAADTLYLDRARKRDLLRVMDTMDAKLKKGLGIVVFPEGTSTRGEDILPLRPSLLQYAVDRAQPVHWATLVYRTPQDEMIPSRAVCWWGNEALHPHLLRLLALSRIDVSLSFGSEPVRGDERKQLAEGLRQAMLSRFTPMP